MQYETYLLTCAAAALNMLLFVQAFVVCVLLCLCVCVCGFFGWEGVCKCRTHKAQSTYKEMCYINTLPRISFTEQYLT